MTLDFKTQINALTQKVPSSSCRIVDDLAEEGKATSKSQSDPSHGLVKSAPSDCPADLMARWAKASEPSMMVILPTHHIKG